LVTLNRDSSITVDTTIFRNNNDSFYYLIQVQSKYFKPILQGHPTMLIMAENHVRKLPGKKFFLMISMHYTIDSVCKNSGILKMEFNTLSNEFKSFFQMVEEKTLNNRNKELISKGFYLNKNGLPTLLIQRLTDYRNQTSTLLLSLYFQLDKADKNEGN
jgi:hypothetical protein